MADQGNAPDEQQLKQRAMRRLAVALTLIALAIAGLALLDRYNASQKKPETPPAPPREALPNEPATPAPPVAPTPAQQPPPQATAPSSTQPPAPPPPVVSNEPLPRAESNQPAPKVAPGVPEATPKPAPNVAPASEKAPPAMTKPPEQPPVKGFLVQVGVFATAEHARALQAKLAEKGIQSSIETRVVIGPFKDRAEADAVTKQLKDLGLQSVVVAPH